MTRPVNLSRYAKQKARAADKARADANVARSGRSKAQKAQDSAQAEKARRDLDGHKQEP